MGEGSQKIISVASEASNTQLIVDLKIKLNISGLKNISTVDFHSEIICSNNIVSIL